MHIYEELNSVQWTIGIQCVFGFVLIVSWHAGDSSSRFLVNDFSVIYEDRGVASLFQWCVINSNLQVERTLICICSYLTTHEC